MYEYKLLNRLIFGWDRILSSNEHIHIKFNAVPARKVNEKVNPTLGTWGTINFIFLLVLFPAVL